MFLKFLLAAFVIAVSLSPSAFAADGAPVSDQDLAKMAGHKYDSGKLPLGDNHYALGGPRKGYIYLCHPMRGQRGGGGKDGPWIHGDTWNINEKTSVQGQVSWGNAVFSNQAQGDTRQIEGNGLPVSHATGIFPIQPNDPASAYDRNPNSIAPQDVRETLPLNPTYTDPPYCMGMEVGYMLSGVPLFNGFDAGLRDAAAHEVQDSCQGHPQVSGEYHYHSLSSCLGDAGIKTVIGYALDGFPITGPMVTKNSYLTTDDLDICHGLTSEIVEDGVKKITYHYVMTMDFPYSVSCFRGKPTRVGPLHGQGEGQNLQSGFTPAIGVGGPQSLRQPPPQAMQACQGQQDGDACSFVTPRRDTFRGVCHMPPGLGAMACVPAGFRPPH